MKKLLFLLLLASASAFGQAGGIPGALASGSGAPGGNCLSTAYVYNDYTTGNWWYCPSAASGFVLGGGGPLARTLQKAETGAADASLLTYTPVAAIGTYKVCTVASVSSATSGVVGFTLSWTDSNGNAQSNVAMSIFAMGTAAPALTFTTSTAANYGGCSEVDINNAGAVITVKWVGGGTTAAKASATISRMS
jgi:hypothetical protein